MGPMKYETIYFDLDGTLTDSAPGITNSLMYALECMGRPVPPRSQLYRYVGPPLWDSFRRYEGMTQAEAQEAGGFFRSYYERAGKFENAVYPGIPALLEGLRARGKRLAVATSKPEPQAVEILQHFGLANCFSCIAGSTLDESRCTKASVLAYALAQQGRRGAVMVGDREHDVLGARENGLPCIGVLFGYGSRQELEAAGADRIAPTVDDLKTMLEE